MKNSFFFAVIFFSFCLVSCGGKPASEDQIYDVSYQRVIESGEIKVGYIPYPPGLIKDPNTGKLSGIFYDTLEAAGKSLGLKINWVEEVQWGTMIEGLKTHRYDLIGSPVWNNSQRARVADFTTPLFYSGICAYVRSDDVRFDSNIGAINVKETRIATIDGDTAKVIADNDFPNATQKSLAQMSDVSALLLDVKSGKSDVTFAEPYFVNLFLINNPGALKNITQAQPLRVFANSMMLNKKEPSLKSMLDVALQEQINSGYVASLISKYAGSANAFYLTAQPYRQQN